MTEQHPNDTPWEGHVLNASDLSLSREIEKTEGEGDDSLSMSAAAKKEEIPVDDSNSGPSGSETDKPDAESKFEVSSAISEKKEITVSMSTGLSFSDVDKLTPDVLTNLYRELEARGSSPNQMQKIIAYAKELQAQGLNIKQIEERLRARADSFSVSDLTNKGSGNLAGTTLGNYQVIEFIAEGGMSEVYKAIDRRSGQVVACKFLLPTLSDVESNFERFMTETKALQKISNPHSVKVFDSGQLNRQPYMILEFICGKPLSKIIAESAESRLSVERTLSIVLQICDVLEEAHKLGIIHRDLKPSNIMLVDSGEKTDFVKVLDFGIANVLDETTKIRGGTNSGEYIGSVPYSSPEQCQGRPVDARTDIYSLACLMFESLVGFPPFNSEQRVEVLFKHINETPPSILLFLKHSLAKNLDPIIKKCLAKNPDQRYETVAELKKDLRQLS